MYLVQILLPLYDNRKHPFLHSDFKLVRGELTEHFGGVTAFVRSPAEGLWKEDDGKVSRDRRAGKHLPEVPVVLNRRDLTLVR